MAEADMFTLKRALPVDAAIVAALNADVQQLHADALPRAYKPPDHASVTPVFAELLADPDTICFVAYDGPTPAGYILMRAVRREENPFMRARAYLYIDQMSVAEAYRGTGCAHLLMEEARALARRMGIAELALDVVSFNDRARRFYAKEGFRVAREIMAAPVTEE